MTFDTSLESTLAVSEPAPEHFNQMARAVNRPRLLGSLTVNGVDIGDQIVDTPIISQELTPKERVAAFADFRYRRRLADAKELLKPEEEILLGQVIEAGREASARLRETTNIFDADQNQRQADVADVGRMEEAIDIFVAANLRLVDVWANKREPMRLFLKGKGVELEHRDLVQEGTFGLMKAAERFDWRRGFKFSTYASVLIKGAIDRAIANTARTIRLPIDVVHAAVVLSQAEHRLELKGLPIDDEALLKELKGRRGIDSSEKLNKIREALGTTIVSYNARVGNEDGEGVEVIDLMADPEADSCDGQVLEELLRAWRTEALPAVLEELTGGGRNLDIIIRLLADGQSTKEVADELGVSPERIRQLEARTLAKLRKPEARRVLEPYLP